MLKLLNFALFYSLWFVCILSAANGYPWLGPVLSVPVFILHLYIARQRWFSELIAITVITLLGCSSDAFYLNLGLLTYAEPSASALTPPLWLVVLWISFATTINYSLAWLKGRYRLALSLGAVGGPLAYWTGWELGSLQWLIEPTLGYCTIALIWMFLLPLLLWVNEKIMLLDQLWPKQHCFLETKRH